MSTTRMPTLILGFSIVALLEISVIKAMNKLEAGRIESSSNSRAARLAKVRLSSLDVFFRSQYHWPIVVKTLLAWEGLEQFATAIVRGIKHGIDDLAFYDDVIVFSLLALVAALYAVLEERYSRLNADRKRIQAVEGDDTTLHNLHLRTSVTDE